MTKETIFNDCNASLNQLGIEDRAFHDWYRFVLSFPPHLVSHYLDRFNVKNDQVVLDPFSGTGTTIIECKKLDLCCIGIEANPMAYFASKTKSSWGICPKSLVMETTQLAQLASHEIDSISDSSEKFNLLPDSQKLILKGSISSRPLSKILALLSYIDDAHTKFSFYDHERLALAKVAVQVSNLRFAPGISVSKKVKEDAPVLKLWQTEVIKMANDILNNKESYALSTVYLGDARIPYKYLNKESIDIVITSPPYPNEKDYTRATRLESVLLGFFQNKSDLQSTKQSLIRSNSRGIYTKDDEDLLVSEYLSITNIANEIEDRRTKWGKTSGFTRLYSRAVKLYFGGMKKHLANLRLVLRPNAHLAYVVGDQASYLQVHIYTGKILAEIAEDLGYEILGIDLFRTRRASKTEVNLREEVLLLRWPG